MGKIDIPISWGIPENCAAFDRVKRHVDIDISIICSACLSSLNCDKPDYFSNEYSSIDSFAVEGYQLLLRNSLLTH